MRVCRMCEYYDPEVPKKCLEDDAEEVLEKERVNFCEWFKPGSGLFDGKQAKASAAAEANLAALFGESDEVSTAPDSALQDAEDLFK